ncbi:hypothetical protein T09_9833 [Trichinella sp. T9]|nr:hypothetical protein T09_9833 [Trichinella sp. T9]
MTAQQAVHHLWVNMTRRTTGGRLKNLKSIRLVQSKKEIDGKAQCISFQVLSDLFSSNATTDPNG